MKGLRFAVTSALAVGAVAVGVQQAHAQVTAAELKGIYGAELRVLGAVESVDLSHGTLTVEGQRLLIGKDTAFSYNGVEIADQAKAIGLLQPGDFVAVSGRLDEP
ncbi:MAG TPA: DUF5666 domain-containing protein, partial [Steroidobacteraceae bacterium]|nr:DUF5666 domain-containing protein [Steroidobacteraceae bacterium]